MAANDIREALIGTSPVRPDGVAKVTGRAIYGADYRVAGLLYGRVKRSPYAHARIQSIDTSKAAALPGVKAVITAADFPNFGDRTYQTYRGVEPLRWLTDRIIARDTVLHRGHAVAAVAATDAHIAEDALELIDVQYEVLQPVLSVREALDPDAPLLFDPDSVGDVEGLFDRIDGRGSNIARRTVLDLGDIQAGFEQAEIVIEREFETGSAHQGYIEPPNGSAFWAEDGKLTVWCSSQGHFGIRQALSDILELPLNDVRVVPLEIGGGFGGKTVPYVEPLAAMLAKHAHRPVKITMSRTEVFEAAGPTSATVCRVKVGAMQDGTLVAAEAHLQFEAGAFPGSPVTAGAMCAFSPYDIANAYVVADDIVVNKPKVMAYRAPGAPAAEFAVESVVDELARKLDVDPIALRLQNAAIEGCRRGGGAANPSIGTVEVLQAIEQSPQYRSELSEPNSGVRRGRGVAAGFWFNGGGESSAYAMLNADGTVHLATGSVDIGGQRASLAMQFAEAMGMAYRDVDSQVADTESIGFTRVTGGSRTTFATGWAVYEAALDMRRQLEERAAKIWDVDATEVNYQEGSAMIDGPADPEGNARQFTLKDLASRLQSTGGLIQGRADTSHTTIGPALAAHVVDLEIDPETGRVEILRYTAAQDVGTAVHPAYVEGQIQGGVAQGIGMALHEDYVYDAEGVMRNASYLDYRMPTSLDLPGIETLLVEVPNPGQPYGVRGVGEVPIVPPLAAVANAICDALGQRISRLPASPTTILEGILSEAD